jgi:Mrp family chromosome partitioning ATPase
VKQVSGVIVVVRPGKSTRGAVSHLKNQLEHLDAPTLGIVVNAVPKASHSYGYGYGYGYGYASGHSGEGDGTSSGARDRALSWRGARR